MSRNYLNQIYRSILTSKENTKQKKKVISRILRRDSTKHLREYLINKYLLSDIHEDMPEEEVSTSLVTVDLSSQGLTLVPQTLFTRTDVNCLDLSRNNIRSLPTDIINLQFLQKVDISRNGLNCMHVNDFSSLPREMEKLPFLKILNISECNLMYIPATVWRLCTLVHLDISRNKINTIPGDLGNLNKLKYFNAQQTGISTVPLEIVCCEDLEILLLFGNPITSLPDTMREMANLHTLNINSRVFSSTIDELSESLLQKGQIQSEHIPSVLFEIKALRSLDLEQCKINKLPSRITDSLQSLNICTNYLNVLPPVILSLTQLTILEFSDNNISVLPSNLDNLVNLCVLIAERNSISFIIPQINKLTSLEHLNLNNNKIKKFAIELVDLKKLKFLSLENNEIETLPDELCNMLTLETLNLTGNKIRKLPAKTYQLTKLTCAHTFKGLFKFGLWLHKNPLKNPPPEVWKTENTSKIWHYLKSMEIRNIKSLQRTKVIFLGDYQSGKTSFLQSFLSGRPTLKRPEEDTTSFFETHEWVSPNFVQIHFVDVGCHEIFSPLLLHLLDNDALYIVTFDVGRYAVHGFQQVSNWLRVLQRHVPGAVVKLLGTKCDCVLKEELGEEVDLVESASDDDKDKEIENVDIPIEGLRTVVEENEAEETEASADADEDAEKDEEKNCEINVEGEEKISEIIDVNQIAEGETNTKTQEDVLQSICEQVMEDLNCFQRLNLEEQRQAGIAEENLVSVRVLNDISMVSCRKKLLNVHEFSSQLELLITNEDLFPRARRYIPADWLEFCAVLKKRLDCYFLSLEEVEEMASAKRFNIKESTLESCLKFLHSSGRIFWQHRDPCLRRFLCHRISFMRRVVNCIYRKNISQFLDFEENALFRSRGNFTLDSFTKALNNFLNFGEFSLPFLNCFLLELQVPKMRIDEVTKLLQLLGLGFRLHLPVVPDGAFFYQPVFIMPNFVRELANSVTLTEFWPAEVSDFSQERLKCHATIQACVHFEEGAPNGLWDQLCVRLHDMVNYRIDWCNAVYAQSGLNDGTETIKNLDETEKEKTKKESCDVHILLRRSQPNFQTDETITFEAIEDANTSDAEKANAHANNLLIWFITWLKQYCLCSPGIRMSLNYSKVID